ncbi:SNF2 domain-containing protein [Hibiscus syriacus]|uniref:SNF2 domain-containing protein n=1 Tax=Hibiscus syriacus TaxID=106335 RepID=A0A6A2ZXZ8_HIBSY|nr:helicase-like transcription factor CHR28 [Hibiscus syriacus]XP_039008967.1 helicase-like transcription factor CHR28 [Hibiscus syriacus]KAE8696603.1 SNF2 domain-containing protein [Hibiscus syriacus]
MAAVNPIDISSSDSEFETEDTGERNASFPRVLPQWAVTNGTNSSTGDVRQSRKISNQAHFSNLSSSFVNDHSGKAKASSQHSALDDGSEYLTMNGNIGQPRTVNSRISNGPATDFEKPTSQQALKRTLPPSLQHFGQSSKPDHLVNAGSSQIHVAPGNSNNLGGPTFSYSQGYMRDHYSRGNTDGVSYGNTSRILPPSFLQGNSVNFTQFAGPENPVYHAGISDERVPISDERMIYQAALEDLSQPKAEASIPDGLLSVPLFRHQKIALHWMLQRETRTRICAGGILADDQGLGKTISMIALIQMQKFLESKLKPEDPEKCEVVALNLDDDDDNGTSGTGTVKQNREPNDTKSIPEVSASSKAISRQRLPAGTLVVCPATVLRQWARELDEKVGEESKLSVLIYHGGSRTKDPSELAKYDVVLTTYSLVTNEVPKQAIAADDEIDERTAEKYGLSSDFLTNIKRKKTSNVAKNGKKGRKGIDGSLIDSSAGALARVNWLRVILDEAQTIKNHRTQVARACCGLRAKRRWCLSGTPIQNAIDDLYSYFRFLKHEPYDVYKSFCFGIKVPIARDHVKGYKKLQAVLKIVMLRRTKATLIDGEPIIKLPPKSINMSKVDFTAEERAFYTQLEADSRSLFKQYAAAGTLHQNYANILLMLLRLRQACDHPLLVKGFNSDSIRDSDSVQNSDPVGKVSVEMAKILPRELLLNLLNCLEASFAICLVCHDTPDDPVVTMCSHVFCYQCVSEYLTGDDHTCPAPECKEQLADDIVFSKPTLRSCLAGEINGSPTHPQSFEKSAILLNDYSSSKIKAVIEILRSKCLLKNSSPESPSSIGISEIPSTSEQTFTETGLSGSVAVKRTTVYSNSLADGPIKAIVFSQWTGMLDLVELALRRHGINYRRLDGKMTLLSRDRNVEDFNADPEVTVMIMSLKAGNLGLNMVAACHVILLDLWWNPTTEDQAIDRAHRIGQTRPVTVTRITIKDTVEDRILSLQEEKRKMVASAFGEDQSGGTATRLTVEDLRYLFMGN